MHALLFVARRVHTIGVHHRKNPRRDIRFGKEILLKNLILTHTNKEIKTYTNHAAKSQTI